LALALEKREIIFPANWAGLTEFKSFSLQTRNAMYGHDDCIMCLSIAFARLETALRRRGGALAADLGTVSRAKSRFR
jgi:hypothetical protein